MALKVRNADTKDARALARVHSSSWRWAYRDLLPASYLDGLRPKLLEQRWARKLADGDLEEGVCVAEVDGKVGGFVTFGPHHDPSWLGYAGEVFMLYVEPELVGQGVGHALLESAFERLEDAQCYWLVVWVLARNERAKGFYERAGLQPDGARRWDPFGERTVPVVRYARALNPLVDLAALSRPSKAR